MKLGQLKPSKGAKHKRKRVGRGPGSGHGKTSGRGHKGSKSRSGKGVYLGFEGGQMPLFRRVPKRGFTNIFRKKCRLVNVESLNRFKEGTKVTPGLLKAEGLVKGKEIRVKILGEGKLDRALTVQAHYFSQGARRKIEEAEGKAEVIS